MSALNNLMQCQKENKSLYFFLPDGPYGRPFDNQYFLQSLSDDDKGLYIELSDGIHLLFTPSPHMEEISNGIVIKNYEKLHFRSPSKNIVYEDGEVMISIF